MKVDLNGLRISTTRTMNSLADEVDSALEYLPGWKAEELREAYNDAARNVSTCLIAVTMSQTSCSQIYPKPRKS